MRKAIVIGLDGGTLDLLGPMVEKGQLPGLKALMERGVWGRLSTVIPPGTGPAWSTIITGLDPSNHGIADLIVRAEGSYDLAFLNAASLRAPTVWDIVGDCGGTVLVLNVPMTYPPREVNGYQVTGLMTPVGASEWTYPADFADTVRGIDPSYRVVPSDAYVPGREAAFLEAMTALVRSKARVLRGLLKTLDCSFVMQVFSETDFVQHALWHLIDPLHPRHRPQEAVALRGRILDFYRVLDDLIADVTRAADDQTAIIVLSDHGAGPLEEFIHANNLLIEKGLLRVKRGWRSRFKRALFRAGLTPLNVYRFGAALRLGRVRMGLRWTSKGYGLLRRFFFSFSDIDWANSTAYAISGGVYGGVFLNLEGREPLGSVPKEDYARVRDDLRETLLSLRHPRTGAPLVKQVLAREEVYGGKFLGELPDLYFLPSRPVQAVFGDFEFSSNKVVEPASTAISAQHRMDGIFVAAGAGVMRGREIKGLAVADVVPLVLYLMDLPIPRGLDGRLNTEVLDQAELARRPPAYTEPRAPIGTGGKPRQATDDESIKQRLKGLGYIS